MKTFVRNNAVFLLLSLTLCGVLGLAILCLSKGDLHLLLCNRHTHARDIFYKYYTQVAEWFPYVVCISLLLCSKIGNGILASACLIISALTTQLLKHAFIAPRPITWFDTHMPHISLPLVDGVEMHSWFSFPSGHTTSFFALMFVIAIITTDQIQKNKTFTICVQIICFLLATLGAYSRIYLSQHFALDVLGGLIVGIGICCACYAFFIRYKDQKWYNYRLFSKKST